MADSAHRKTDRILAGIEKRLEEIYTEAQEGIQKKASAYFSKFEKLDAEKRKLVEEGKLTDGEYAHWRRGKIMYGKRFKAMEEEIARSILNVNQTAMNYVNGEMPEIYALNYNALERQVDGVGGYSFTLTDANTVRHLSLYDGSLLPHKELDPTKDIPWNMKNINSQVLQGILQGDPIDKIAGRILRVQEMNKNAAIRTARTIVTEAENKGRQDSYKQAVKDGIIMKREWIATNDNRVRHWHAELDGVLAEVDEPFENGYGKIMFPGDHNAHPANVYNCRCTLVAKVNGFKKEQVQKAIEKTENQERIRRRREEYFARRQQASEPDFENMTRAQLDKYVSENISAKFGDVSGVNTDFYRKTVKAVKRAETKYGKIDGLNIEFGGIKTNSYAEYVPRTKTLHLKKKGSLSQFADSIANADERAMRKYGVKYNTESSYEGTVLHELGHAIDHDLSFGLSRALGATDEILIKSRSISFYARTQGGYGAPRASEATAENLSSYLMGNTEKIDKDVLTIIEEYFKRKKK